MKFGLTIIVLLTIPQLGSAQERPNLEHAFSTPTKDLISRQSPSFQLKKLQTHKVSGLKVTPLFCRMENKWEKKAGHGVRFRLGDVQTVNEYEGKSNPLSIDR